MEIHQNTKVPLHKYEYELSELTKREIVPLFFSANSYKRFTKNDVEVILRNNFWILTKIGAVEIQKKPLLFSD